MGGNSSLIITPSFLSLQHNPGAKSPNAPDIIVIVAGGT